MSTYSRESKKIILVRTRFARDKTQLMSYQLLDIFIIFGAPSILQSDNGKEFVNSVITELSAMREDLKIVHGKPRHS